jgi:hypothetical protein
MPTTLQPAEPVTVQSARPLHVPEVDDYTGALVEMGAAAAPARFAEAVAESREALRERVVYLVTLYADGCSPHMREHLAHLAHELLDEAARARRVVQP